jgi:hypothetical protein
MRVCNGWNAALRRWNLCRKFNAKAGTRARRMAIGGGCAEITSVDALWQDFAIIPCASPGAVFAEHPA